MSREDDLKRLYETLTGPPQRLSLQSSLQDFVSVDPEPYSLGSSRSIPTDDEGDPLNLLHIFEIIIRTFTCVDDVLYAFNVQNEIQLDRRIYKMTECGAWARFIPPGKRDVGERFETWSAKFVNSITGPRCIEMKHDRKRIALTNVPQAVLDYCLIERDGHCSLGWQTLVTSSEVLKSWVSENVCRLTFKVDVRQQEHHDGGLKLGSIIEDSDAEVVEDLWFPFTRNEFDRTLQGIEDEVDRLSETGHGGDEYDDE